MLMKKGFTLVELLAVIIILGVLTAVTSQVIISNVEDAKNRTYNITVKSIEAAAEVYITKHSGEYDNIDTPGTDIYIELGDLINDGLVESPIKDPRTDQDIPETAKVRIHVEMAGQIIATFLSDFVPTIITFTPNGSVAPVVSISVNVSVSDGDGLISNSLKYQWNTSSEPPEASSFTTTFTNGGTINSPIGVNGGYYLWIYAEDTKNNVAIERSEIFNIYQSDYIISEGVNKPKLVTGMTAVKWNSGTSSWDTVASPDTDTTWYDYTNKEWANAQTSDGSMWVWIPRYIYKITNKWHNVGSGDVSIQFSSDTNDNWNSAVIGSIDTGATSNASNNKWTNHPAFTFGSNELTGIWVAKFEASPDSSSSCFATRNTTNCNVTNINLKIVPAINPVYAAAWNYITVGNAFTVSRNMETNSIYGWGTSGTNIDTHLMKNTEWGAVAMLTRTTYGKNWTYIWVNGNYDHWCGCGSDAQTGPPSNVCNPYYSINGKETSTTGNVYGVYDMAGSSFEMVAAYVNNGNANLNTYGSTLLSADNKYKNVYSFGTGGCSDTGPCNAELTVNSKGDALYETSYNYEPTYNNYSWMSAYSYMPYGSNPWFVRGGSHSDGNLAGVFAYSRISGITDSGSHYPMGFRPVLAIATGL